MYAYQLIASTKNKIMVLAAGSYDHCVAVMKEKYPEVVATVIPNTTYPTFTGTIQIHSVDDGELAKLTECINRKWHLDSLTKRYWFSSNHYHSPNPNEDIKALVDNYDRYLEMLNKRTPIISHLDEQNEYINMVCREARKKCKKNIKANVK